MLQKHSSLTAKIEKQSLVGLTPGVNFFGRKKLAAKGYTGNFSVQTGILLVKGNWQKSCT